MILYMLQYCDTQSVYASCSTLRRYAQEVQNPPYRLMPCSVLSYCMVLPKSLYHPCAGTGTNLADGPMGVEMVRGSDYGYGVLKKGMGV
eukprot:3933459-Rhodomonas_salina.2